MSVLRWIYVLCIRIPRTRRFICTSDPHNVHLPPPYCWKFGISIKKTKNLETYMSRRINVCARGYSSALKYHYKFPTYQAIQHAKNVCSGKLADEDGNKYHDPEEYSFSIVYNLNNIGNFTRATAEQWIDACSRQKCNKKSGRCLPLNKVNELTEDELMELCSGHRKMIPSWKTLEKKVPKSQQFAKVIAKGQIIGLMDTNGDLNLCRPIAADVVKDDIKTINMS